MFTNEDFKRLLVKYTIVSKSQEPRVKSQGVETTMKTMTTDNVENLNTELKNVILDLFDQIRDLNARLAEKDRANMEKDRINASLSENLDAVLENQKQQKLDLESWLAKERQWNKERKVFKKTIKDLNDVVKVLKKAKFVGTSQKSSKNTGKEKGDNGDGNADASTTSAEEPDLAENKEGHPPRGELMDKALQEAADGMA